MSYKHFTFEDRKIIEKMYKSGATTTEIAFTLEKTATSVGRELKRLPAGQYTADAAEKDMLLKKKNHIKSTVEESRRNRQDVYRKIIRCCIRLKPEASEYEIARAAEMPIERVEKYFPELKEELRRKRA